MNTQKIFTVVLLIFTTMFLSDFTFTIFEMIGQTTCESPRLITHWEVIQYIFSYIMFLVVSNVFIQSIKDLLK